MTSGTRPWSRISWKSLKALSTCGPVFPGTDQGAAGEVWQETLVSLCRPELQSSLWNVPLSHALIKASLVNPSGRRPWSRIVSKPVTFLALPAGADGCAVNDHIGQENLDCNLGDVCSACCGCKPFAYALMPAL